MRRALDASVRGARGQIGPQRVSKLDRLMFMDEFPPALERLLDRIVEQEGGRKPAPLAEEYLRAVQELEDLPCNRPGQDKSWVLHVERRERSILETSKRLT